MAERRMMSKKIVDSDAFMDMALSTQALYFHLLARADDDGFVGNPKKIMRMIGASDDEYLFLIGKRFILQFPSGVCVIKHWLIHNYIQKDRYNESQYLEEKSLLKIKDNKAYTEVDTKCIQVVSSSDTQYRLGKDSIGKVSKDKDTNTAEASSALISLVIEMFTEINPACKNMYGNKTQRKACDDLINTYSFDEVKSCIQNVLPRTNGQSYFPTITTPVQLRDKWMALKSAVAKKRGKTTEIIN